MAKKKITVPCSHCMGKGGVALSTAYAESLELVRRLDAKGKAINGAELARMAGIKATAMNNRLRALMDYGLVGAAAAGREKIYYLIGGKCQNERRNGAVKNQGR